MLGQNRSWKEHIKTLEKRLSKNIISLCITKPLVDTESLSSIYFSHNHSYLSITLASTNPTKIIENIIYKGEQYQ